METAHKGATKVHNTHFVIARRSSISKVLFGFSLADARHLRTTVDYAGPAGEIVMVIKEVELQTWKWANLDI